MADQQSVPTRIGEFQVQQKIGEGPRAVVYAARTAAGEECALKILAEEALPKNMAHRARLVQVLQRLVDMKHETVVRVLAAGEQNGLIYVAMERMAEPNLAQQLAAGRPMTEHDVILMGRHVAQALECGREQGLPHGNVTAGNIWPVGNGKYKVSDFAIKKFLSQVPRDTELKGPEAHPEGENGARQSAEDVLRARAQNAGQDMQRDLAMLAALMLQLLDKPIAPQGAEESLDDYRDRLREALQSLAFSDKQVNVHTVNALRQMLTPTACRTAGDAVVELASAMIFQRRALAFADHMEQQKVKWSAKTAQGAPAAQAAPVQASGPAPAVQPAPPAPAAQQAGPQPAAAPPIEGELDVFDLSEVEEIAEAVAVEEAAPAAETAAQGPGQKAATVMGDTDRQVTTFFVLHREGRGEFFTLADEQTITLGRDPDVSQFVVLDSSISRRHCSIRKSGGAITVKDEGSSNGTFVREARVTEVALQAGDVIRIGHCQISVGVPFAAKG